MSFYNGISMLGMIGLMAIAWVLSTNRRNINGRAVLAGVILQVAVAAVVFLAPGSRGAMLWVNGAVVELIGAAQAGQNFLFGPLSNPANTHGFVLVIHGLPMVIFFAATMSLLYYWGIMPKLIGAFSWLFRRLMRISGAESLCTASNIFVGIESATTIRPYLPTMTRSELCMVLTAGMATVASTVLGVYVLMLKDVFPTIAGHLLSASLMSAPAAIVMSKLLCPEDGEPLTLGKDAKIDLPKEEGAMASFISGAMAGVKLLVGIAALLIAVLGALGVLDLFVGIVGHWFGLDWSIAKGLGYVFWPFATMIGIPPSDAQWAGELLGLRMVATEFTAYPEMAKAMAAPGFTCHPRTPVILAYALCGFAHVASLAIFIGGYAALAPHRRNDLVRVGPRALLAATLACLMTGAVAGAFFTQSTQTLLAP